MTSKLTKEQIAHDLAIAYELYLTTQREDSEQISPEGFFADYEHGYKEFLNYLSE
ncbi:MAG: hypothetical protein NC432_08645 [Roseburia sp.]|nr:hypothetical protein [Roseburia sp.]MCM1097819.1 hypothetical protein [Ruminococcus flavefaciens]